MQAESQPLGEKGVGSMDAMTFLESQCFGTFGFPFLSKDITEGCHSSSSISSFHSPPSSFIALDAWLRSVWGCFFWVQFGTF